ncbi:sigma-70 family RNA polymerase sigma factor [Pseudoflavonifractor phocaeensis]|uniref:sigma-70 family RNA polymerase sigma factor n=1 Tax=Pseudoflavonifractor phocaeensis TaxID=1870988 RepID=UPI001957DE04|nr:sigma-70 family RNA polymerase sigma factor [Pseudoflavonifractor phocaeensis]MBM6871085.1 sigma-70 family RNA polymerase sigma factor [Pseudoflavonifractor phocaeensis]MBM6938970.1 sigma-70 family RNA polymerase sigma factor [Pseudoflavonifractor phocaeensis]
MTQAQFAAQLDPLKTRLYRTARIYLASESAALDAVDEAVYQGLVHCRKLREERYFTTWMTRILINVCNDELRRRRREVTMAELPDTAVEAYDALPLRQAVERLPRELRAVVALRYFSGCTIAETAEALSIPAGTVSTRQRKALSLLRLALDDQEEV